ncbi:hypothetical protein DM806_02695, partial [Sphingobium lactosutens]|nr:hypothetical protein [Sphingobium lactosutens]
LRDNDPPDHYLTRCAPRRIGRTKGGLNSKLHAVCDGKGTLAPARNELPQSLPLIVPKNLAFHTSLQKPLLNHKEPAL